jgi:cephalosporin hydroxylase
MAATTNVSNRAGREVYAADHVPNAFPVRPFLWFFSKVVMKVPFLKRLVVDLFENVYYYSAATTWDNMSWMGASCQKYPTDLWVYQEIIFDRRPDLIIETGSLHGGSALYFANLFDMIGHGHVISVDLKVRDDRPKHNRITYISGHSSVDPVVDERIRTLLDNYQRRMVILDSDHQKHHVMAELAMYQAYVTKDQYLISEDSSINGHPVACLFGPGPFEAVQEFISGNQDFVLDRNKEKFLISASHGGFLLRVR